MTWSEWNGEIRKVNPKGPTSSSISETENRAEKKTEENFCSEANCEYQNGKDALGTEKPFLEHP